MDLGMLLQLGRLHGPRRTRRRVIERDMQGTTAVATGHAVDEPQESGPGMPRHAVPEHAPAGHLQKRVQAGGGTAPIVVRLPHGQARAQGEQRLGATPTPPAVSSGF